MKTGPPGAWTVLHLVCALALVLSTLLHAGAAPRLPDADLNAYRLPDGSLPVLCIGGESRPDGTQGPTCPHCTLCAMPALPVSQAVAVLTVPLRASHRPGRVMDAAAADRPSAFRARAPPVLA